MCNFLFTTIRTSLKKKCGKKYSPVVTCTLRRTTMRYVAKMITKKQNVDYGIPVKCPYRNETCFNLEVPIKYQKTNIRKKLNISHLANIIEPRIPFVTVIAYLPEVRKRMKLIRIPTGNSTMSGVPRSVFIRMPYNPIRSHSFSTCDPSD